MNTRNLSIIAYLTLIGWVISYTQFEKEEKSQMLQYHLRQSLGIMTIGIIYQFCISLINCFFSTIGLMLYWGYLLLFILLVFGMINALNDTTRPVPLIGKYFENQFLFIE